MVGRHMRVAERLGKVCGWVDEDDDGKDLQAGLLFVTFLGPLLEGSERRDGCIRRCKVWWTEDGARG